eukprot:362982-Chlamydomonas_euryale.AAC.9
MGAHTGMQHCCAPSDATKQQACCGAAVCCVPLLQHALKAPTDLAKRWAAPGVARPAVAH